MVISGHQQALQTAEPVQPPPAMTTGGARGVARMGHGRLCMCKARRSKLAYFTKCYTLSLPGFKMTHTAT
eukprot:scaffold66149_cov57-Phaeocystis_antarctica.AAC.1